jgi:hypothetical protein
MNRRDREELEEYRALKRARRRNNIGWWICLFALVFAICVALTSCSSGNTPSVLLTPSATPTSIPEATHKPFPKDEPEKTVYYANCTAVRDAGAAPIYRGEPGCSRKLDRDGDGVACDA